MIERRGTVYAAPIASYVPSGRMVDPQASIFCVSWQDWHEETQRGELVEDGGEIAGADEAIAWGRARCDRVLIRLGHTDETHFSAGHVPLSDQTDGRGRPYPLWPPERAPAEGWWTPSDETAAEEEAVEQARHQAVDRRRMGVLDPETRPDPYRGDGPWTGA
jgi:hypothetical protein